MGGTKFDSGKPRMELIPAEAVEEIAEVFTFGAKKYGDHNFKKGITYGRLLGALLRHVFAFVRGEDLDPETGKSHIAHAGCCCMMLLYMIEHYPDLDDRNL